MTPLGAQRWRAGRESYRPAGETIRPSEYDASWIDEDARAKAFVVREHYSGSYPAARERIGLYRRGELVGVAVLSHPMSDRVLTNVFPGAPVNALAELGRFVLLDEVPANGETWFLARAFELLRTRGYEGVVSFSDPVARSTADGRVVHPGHVGVIYQAHNARYLGRGDARTLRLLPDGRVFSHRVVSKIRNGERGWRSSAAALERYGADAPPDDVEARRAWLEIWLARLTRPLRHAGNHRYAWALARSRRPTLAAGAPYPKQVDRAQREAVPATWRYR